MLSIHQQPAEHGRAGSAGRPSKVGDHQGHDGTFGEMGREHAISTLNGASPSWLVTCGNHIVTPGK
jgi:hypothetical protein